MLFCSVGTQDTEKNRCSSRFPTVSRPSLPSRFLTAGPTPGRTSTGRSSSSGRGNARGRGHVFAASPANPTGARVLVRKALRHSSIGTVRDAARQRRRATCRPARTRFALAKSCAAGCASPKKTKTTFTTGLRGPRRFRGVGIVEPEEADRPGAGMCAHDGPERRQEGAGRRPVPAASAGRCHPG